MFVTRMEKVLTFTTKYTIKINKDGSTVKAVLKDQTGVPDDKEPDGRMTRFCNYIRKLCKCCAPEDEGAVTIRVKYQDEEPGDEEVSNNEFYLRYPVRFVTKHDLCRSK